MQDKSEVGTVGKEKDNHITGGNTYWRNNVLLIALIFSYVYLVQ